MDNLIHQESFNFFQDNPVILGSSNPVSDPVAELLQIPETSLQISGSTDGNIFGLNTTLDDLILAPQALENLEGAGDRGLDDPLTGMNPERLASQNDLPELIEVLSGTQTYTKREFVGSSDPGDLYQFTVQQPSNFSLRLDELVADADVLLYQDSNGNGVPEDNEFLGALRNSGSVAETLNTNLPSGTYFVDVRQNIGDTPYKLSLSIIPDIAGNSLNQSFQVGLLSESPIIETEFVGNVDSEDFYRFSLNTESNVSVLLDGLSANADMELIWDINGNGIIESPNQTGFNENIASSSNADIAFEEIRGNLDPGSYYIRVHQYSGDTNYRLTLQAIPATEIILDFPTISGLNGAYNNREFVGNLDPQDIYSFTLETPSSFSLVLDDLSGDADVALLQDGTNNYIPKGASTQPGTNPEIIQSSVLDVGTYYILVERYLNNETNYTLTLSATPINPEAIAVATQPYFDSNFGFSLVDASAAVARAIGQNPFLDVPNPMDNSYGVSLVNAPEVWNQGITGEGVIVAVLDSGVDFRHSDLASNIWVNPDEIPDDRIDNDANGFIDDVHGFDFVNYDADPAPSLIPESSNEPALRATENLAIAVGSIDSNGHLADFSNPARHPLQFLSLCCCPRS